MTTAPRDITQPPQSSCPHPVTGCTDYGPTWTVTATCAAAMSLASHSHDPTRLFSHQDAMGEYSLVLDNTNVYLITVVASLRVGAQFQPGARASSVFGEAFTYLV